MENSIKDHYTSVELSKKLQEAGCEIESEKMWARMDDDIYNTISEHQLGDSWQVMTGMKDKYPAYDLMWDICIKHRKEFLREPEICWECGSDYITNEIVTCLHEGRKREAEQYIWRHCLFNKEK